MSTTAIVGVIGGLLAAVVAFMMLEARPPEQKEAEPAPEPTPEPSTR
jgi:hypothetical protein